MSSVANKKKDTTWKKQATLKNISSMLAGFPEKTVDSWNKIRDSSTGNKNENAQSSIILSNDSLSGNGKPLKPLNKVSNDGNTPTVTFSSVKGRDSRKIADFFLSHPDEPFTPKQLAFFNKIAHGSAKMICLRFFQKGYIEQPLINHYQYKRKITAEELEIIQKYHDIKVHNIMLTVGNTSGNTLGVTPIQATNPKTLKSKFQIGETQVKIFRYVQKTVVYIECSTHPLDAIEFYGVLKYIEGAGYNLKGAEIKRFEFNIDVPDMQIFGAQCIELTTFAKAWQRMYNKNGNLRDEVIVRGASISPDEIIAALRGRQALGTNVLVKQVAELVAQGKQIELSNKQIYQIIGNLLRRMDRFETARDPAQRRIEDYFNKIIETLEGK